MQQHVTLMITSTFYDMFGEYHYFVNEIFPYLKKFCAEHDIVLDYKDVAFSLLKDYTDKSIILEDLRSIDSDRTFFICFRGQKLGWRPTYKNVNELTIDEYPELVKFVGNVSITELTILHALLPFDRFVDDELKQLPPVKHSLFYFRNPDYIDNLSEVQKFFFDNGIVELDKEVKDMEIAKAKDIVFEIKRDFAKKGDKSPSILIRNYDCVWDKSLDMKEIFLSYANGYAKVKDRNLDDFIVTHLSQMCHDHEGCHTDFTYEGRPLKDVIIEDITSELKREFPKNFS